MILPVIAYRGRIIHSLQLQQGWWLSIGAIAIACFLLSRHLAWEKIGFPGAGCLFPD